MDAAISMPEATTCEEAECRTEDSTYGRPRRGAYAGRRSAKPTSSSVCSADESFEIVIPPLAPLLRAMSARTSASADANRPAGSDILRFADVREGRHLSDAGR